MRAWLIILATTGCWGGDKEPEKQVEICNGIDDDEDGSVDEGFGDEDADGMADCIDDSCALELPSGGAVEITTECDTVGADQWDVDELWHYTDSAGGVQVMPAVGQLGDDNADGVIDDGDTPDIAVVTLSHTLLVLAGDTGETEFEVGSFWEKAGPIIADVDGDGKSEVVAMSDDYEIVAIDGEGTEKWRSEAFDYDDSHFVNGAVGDLEGDGTAEVVYGFAVVSGDDGSTEMTLDRPVSVYSYTLDGFYYYYWYYYDTVIADLDQDGKQEIIFGENVYDYKGDVEWTIDADGYDVWYFTSPVNVDDDSKAELLVVGVVGAWIYDDDGTYLTDISDALYGSGIPCAADFDGDGDVDLGLPDLTGVYVYTTDGTSLWYAGGGSYWLAGCSAYDFDDDGAYELVYGSEMELDVFDGAEGLTLYSDTEHGQLAVMEYPVVVDADGDGVAEIVAPSSGSETLAQGNDGVTIYDQPSNLWSRTGSVWASHDYRGVNVLEDGSVPTSPDDWDEVNLSRGKPATSPPVATDLAIEYVGSCVAGCPAGNASIGFQVRNQGDQDMPSGVPVTLYAADGDDLFPIKTIELDAIAAGASLDGQSFEVAASNFGPDGFVIRLDDRGDGSTTIGDCDRTNNLATYVGSLCE